MLARKNLIFSIAVITGFVCSTVLAFGPDVVPEPLPNQTGFYAEGNLGYALVDWRGVISPPTGFGINISNGIGGFTGGGALGYQWNPFVGLEGGAYYLSPFKFNANFLSNQLFGTVHINQWFGYFAAKLSAPIPIIDNLDAFVKIGAAYRSTQVSVTTSIPVFIAQTATSNLDRWEPVFAAGAQYYFYYNWYATVQWMYVGESGPAPFPAVHSFTGGIGYLFAF